MRIETVNLRHAMRLAFHVVFRAGQRIGLDILPRHFYSSIPDIAELRADASWRNPRSMVDVRGADISHQMTSLRQWCSPFRDRIANGTLFSEITKAAKFTGYGPVETAVLYCFISENRPSKIIQIGAGVSTAAILKASRDVGYSPEVVCVDPFPGEFLREQANANAIKLIEKKAQDLDLEELTNVGHGDLLFIDSTHTVSPGSEVNRLLFEVVPRLRQGAFVHFHDIYFPYDYSPLILEQVFFSNESVLLHAFLTGNDRFSIVVSMSMLHHACPQEVVELLPIYHPVQLDRGLGSGKFFEGRHFPSSIYLARR